MKWLYRVRGKMREEQKKSGYSDIEWMRKIKIYLILMVSLIISQPGCALAAKKTPMQTPSDMAYCWMPDGEIAFYRRIDHWIKYEPDPFPGGGGVYDDYKKDDEAFIVVRAPETKEGKVLFKIPYKGSAPTYIQCMDWSGVSNEILLSSGVLEAIKSDGKDFRVVLQKEGGLCGYGKWSPDGKQILYAYLPYDPRYMSQEDVTKMIARGEKPGLYIINVDGSSDKFLIEGKNGSWSPDGSRVVYQTITRKTTSEERKTKPELYRNIFYTSDIYIINTDGTGKRLLVEWGQNPKWSPDGKWIMYHVMGETYLITPDGTEKCQINGYGIWSHDGKSILSKSGHISLLRIITRE